MRLGLVRRRRFPALLGALSVLVLALAGAGCASTPPLRVASDLANPPFASVSEDGTPEGRDVEMMHRLAARVGREVSWVRMPFDALVDAAARGEVDVVCATLGVTEEREERVDFTRPYFETRIAAVVRRDGGPETLAALAAAPGARVGASVGTTSEDAVSRVLPRAAFVPSGDGDAIEAVLSGALTAAVMDGPAADRRAREDRELRVLVEPLAVERYALALPEGSPWRAPLDAALDAMQDAGELDALDHAHGLR